MAHGFLREPWGSFITFDASDAGNGAGQGTFPFSNNSPGEITGYVVDANGAYHAFLRLEGSFEGSFADPAVADVPEPSTWALMLIGFAGLGFVGYRRARAEGGDF